MPFSPTSVISPLERRAKSGLSAQALRRCQPGRNSQVVVTLTVKDKVVKRFIVIVREQNVILDCSTHNPVHGVSEYADARCSRWLTKDSEVHRRQFHTLRFCLPPFSLLR